MTATQRRNLIAELDQQGLSAAAIASQLGCSQRTVHRARSKRRAAGDTWTWTAPEPDEAAIERAAAGDPPAELTWVERRAAIEQCERWGLPVRVIAARVGCTTETVYYARRRAAA
ncbi:helix-turn-helix domain-containing protein [Streptomyces rishiriensis]|uniref:helix-turn-helix domain-containing protein n=1 Tax=Streptomyces rishiriensis TaxID=68264 RepID=UPI00131F3F00|nr:helix-turn-helix domain-containing protein [Streptomyces rishiriensis]